MRGVSLAGWGAMLVLPESAGAWPVWGLLVTGILQLIKQFVDHRHLLRINAQKHEFEVKDREAANQAREKLQLSVEANTAITLEVGAKADAAYEVGNHINEKIAGVTKALLAKVRGQ